MLEAFAYGAIGGGGIAIVIYVAFAQRARGRSTTAAFLPATTAAVVLMRARAYLSQERMDVRAIPGGVSGRSGSPWLTGVRVLELRSRDREGGADVWVEAYLEGFYPREINLDPDSWFGVIPRQKALALANRLMQAIGAPTARFHHVRAP